MFTYWTDNKYSHMLFYILKNDNFYNFIIKKKLELKIYTVYAYQTSFTSILICFYRSNQWWGIYVLKYFCYNCCYNSTTYEYICINFARYLVIVRLFWFQQLIRK